MSVMLPRARIWVLAGCLLGFCPHFAVVAAAEDAQSRRDGQCETGFRGPPGPRPPPMVPGFGKFGPDSDEGRPPPYLMDLALTEDQQDKVFAILHAAAPLLREQAKAERKARDALREFTQSAQYDDGHATLLAQAQAKAESQLWLVRTRVDHDVYLLLTTEQRAQITDRQREWASHRSDVPPPPGETH